METFGKPSTFIRLGDCRLTEELGLIKRQLMSEREELEWSNQRFDDIIGSEGLLILAQDDPRVLVVQSVCSRLIQALQVSSTDVVFSMAAGLTSRLSNKRTNRQFRAPTFQEKRFWNAYESESDGRLLFRVLEQMLLLCPFSLK